jgi:hypothetical protein
VTFQVEGWSEPIATNAPVVDEVVQAILGMKQKHILPYGFWFFQTLICPKVFPSYLPPPSYLPHSILRSLHCQKSGDIEVRR